MSLIAFPNILEQPLDNLLYYDRSYARFKKWYAVDFAQGGYCYMQN